MRPDIAAGPMLRKWSESNGPAAWPPSLGCAAAAGAAAVPAVPVAAAVRRSDVGMKVKSKATLSPMSLYGLILEPPRLPKVVRHYSHRTRARRRGNLAGTGRGCSLLAMTRRLLAAAVGAATVSALLVQEPRARAQAQDRAASGV